MKFGLKYHKFTAINIILPFQKARCRQNNVQLPIKVLIEDMFQQQLFATKFNFSNLQIVLYALVIFRFPVVFDLLMQFACNLHNHMPG